MMRYRPFVLIMVSFVAAFSKPPFFADFLRRLFNNSQKSPDEYDRVLRLIADVANAQLKTQEAQTNTDKQIRMLLNYNRNRDEELEEVIEETLIEKLRDEEWTVSKVGFTEIFRSDGRKLLEWDGIIQGKHKKRQKRY